MSFEGRLTNIVDHWHLAIDSGCRGHLIQMIQDAAQKHSGIPLDEPKMREAETNLEKLLTEMTWQAGVMGFTELHEPTFFAALSKLCPLFPFC